MDLAALHSFHFQRPLWLLALPLLWGLVAWFSSQSRRDGGWAAVIDADLLPFLRLKTGGRSHAPWWLLALVWTLAALALTGMTWQREQSAAFRAPTDWILVLDLSPSMAARDIPPDRVTRARYVISDILSAAKDARVALVVFAGEAHTVAPLTTDVATIRALLPPLAPSIMPEAGDQLEPALDEVSRLMRTVSSRQAEVIILTDGVADPAESLQAVQRLRQQGAVVNVIGVGTASGAPQPNANGEFVRDASGGSVLTQLPVDQLERIAAAGGGRYAPLNEARGIIASLQSMRTGRLGNTQVAAGQHLNRWIDGGIWMLPPLLLLVPLFARRGWL